MGVQNVFRNLKLTFEKHFLEWKINIRKIFSKNIFQKMFPKIKFVFHKMFFKNASRKIFSKKKLKFWKKKIILPKNVFRISSKKWFSKLKKKTWHPNITPLLNHHKYATRKNLRWQPHVDYTPMPTAEMEPRGDMDKGRELVAMLVVRKLSWVKHLYRQG